MRVTTDTFADIPASPPHRTVRENMIAFWGWFQDQPPERQDAYRQKVRAANAEEEG